MSRTKIELTNKSASLDATDYTLVEEKIKKIQKSFIEAESGNALKRFDLGVEVGEFLDAPGPSYGLYRIETLANRLNIEKDVLYEYKRVSNAWSRAQFEALLTAARSTTLSWTHLTTIASVKEPARRAELVEQVVSEKLTVQALRERIGGSNGKTRKVRKSDPFEQLVTSSEQLASDASRLIAEFLEPLQALHKTIPPEAKEKLEKVKEMLTAQVLKIEAALQPSSQANGPEPKPTT